ncbi:MAG: flagellar hook-length control protein FliK [Oscillospiraceae bacterium]|nr:flagellar hook-length control protein FliK [Oscillospiraceae bacterium]
MPEGIRLEPIGPNSGASSSRVAGRRQTAVTAENIGTQARSIAAAEVSPETAEAIRTALKSAPIDILQKALRDADVQITQYTMDIVKSLINGSLPLTEENIVDLLLQSHVFKDAQPDILALMMRLEIPATPENIEQFENLINNSEKLAQNLENLINRLPAEIFRGANSLPELSFVLDEIVKMTAAQPNHTLLTQTGQDEQNRSAELPNAAREQENNQTARPVLTRAELGSLINMLKNFGASNRILNRIININRQNAEVMRAQTAANSNNAVRSGGNTPVAPAVQGGEPLTPSALGIISGVIREAAERVLQNPQEPEANRVLLENAKNVLEGPAVQKLIKAEIQGKWVLTPSNLTGGPPEISRYYNELNGSLHKFARLLQLLSPKTADNPVPVSQNTRTENHLYIQAKNVQDNLRLMNEFGKTMPFLQIPLRLSGNKIINSDLYIFNNKKRKHSSPVQSANAMIKLELENMGVVKVYINLAGRSARARFLTDKSESVREIERHLPELEETIHNLGFNFTGAAASAVSEEEFDVIEDFINRELPKTEIKKYILNKKI